MQVDFEGKVHEFPDDFTDAEVAAALKSVSAAPAPAAPAAPMPSGATKVNALGIPMDNDYVAPKKDAPLISKETAGSLVGTVIGGGAGVLTAPLTGPFGAVGGAAIGSALGAGYGAYLDAQDRGEDPNAALNSALNAAGVDLAWSVGGGVVLKYAGKTAKYAAGTPVAEWVANKFGKSLQSAPLPKIAAGAEKIGPKQAGETIFKTTTPDEAARLAREAATDVQSAAAREGRGGMAPSQITGGSQSFTERQARAGEGVVFSKAQEGNERYVQDQLVAMRDRIARKDMSDPLARAATGQKLGASINATETAIKDRHRATFEMLSDPKGPLQGAGTVNARDLVKMVDQELARTVNPEKIATLKAMKGKLGTGLLDLSKTNEFIKEWGAEAAGRSAAGKSDDAVQALYSRMTASMRGKFDEALDSAVASGKLPPELVEAIRVAKADYSTMHKTLYSGTGSKLQKVAMMTPEDVLNVIAQKGATTEIAELRRIVALAQTTGNNVAAVDARAALRELQGAFFQRHLPDAKAMANLPERLRTDKEFADQFALFIPDTKGVRLAMERLGQAAQQVERGAKAGGAANTGLVTGYGMQAGSSAAIGLAALVATRDPVLAAVAGMVGAGAGTVAVGQWRKALAHSLTKPTLRDKMPAVSAYAIAVAAGKKVGVPQAVQAWYDELKADGFVPEPEAPAAAPVAEAPINDQVDPNQPPLSTREDILASERAFTASPQGQQIIRNMRPAEGPGKTPVSWRTSPDAMLEDLNWAMAQAKTPEERVAIQAEMRRARGMR
jgi:hypothetical protein